MTPQIVKLDNPVLDYAWGSREAIATLQGRPTPTAGPEAELWIGDHPAAPSRVGDEPLGSFIARDPEAVLGAAVSTRTGGHLPFLTKILAAAAPLSVQVHPDAPEARAGFLREESGEVPPSQRSYRDPNPKREVLIALSPFEALAGFRGGDETERFVRASGSDTAIRLFQESTAGAVGSRAAAFFLGLQDLPAAVRTRLFEEVLAHAKGTDTPEARELHWIRQLCEQHPGDPLVVAPWVLNRVALSPGEALVVRPGTVHSYLAGTGVEVMTRSDNVVRGGLTEKHVDRAELRRLATPEASPAHVVTATASRLEGGAVERRYATGIDDFEVSVLEPGVESPVLDRAGGCVTVLLCVEGAVELREGPASTGVSLRGAEAALVPACVSRYQLCGTADGSCRVFAVSARRERSRREATPAGSAC